MGEFRRELLPSAETFFEQRGLKLVGHGKWRTTRCEFHGGSDSMRVKVESGGWVCMSCGPHGGDVVDYVMQADGSDFLTAIKALGAYTDDGKGYQWRDRPRTLPARDAMEVITLELFVILVVIADIRRGVIPSDADWQRFLDGVGRIQHLAGEYRS